MNKDETLQQQKQPTNTPAKNNSASNQSRHQQTSAQLSPSQIANSNSNSISQSGPHQASLTASTKNFVSQTQIHTMAMHNFGQSSANQTQGQLKNQSETPWHVSAKNGANNNNQSINNNNNNNSSNNSNLGDLQTTSKSTTSPSGSAFNSRQQTNLQSQQNQQYGLLNPQLPASIQSSLASRVDQIIRNTLNDSPSYTPPTGNSCQNNHNSMPSPSSSASMMINPVSSLSNFPGQQNVHLLNSGAPMSPLTSFHGSVVSNLGDTNANLMAKTPAHSSSHPALSTNTALQLLNHSNLQRPQQLAHTHQPFGLNASRSPSNMNNSSLVPQAAHGNNLCIPRLGVTSTTSSDHHNHIHIPNSNQSDHIADYTSRLHALSGQPNGSNKTQFIPTSRHPLTAPNWHDLSQINNNSVARFPMPHGINTAISQQPPLPTSISSVTFGGAGSSNFMIGQESDNLLRLNVAMKNDQRVPSLPCDILQHGDSRNLHSGNSGPFAKMSYPGLEHFKVPAIVAENALKVQQSQQRLGRDANCIPETVAIYALNLSGTNIPGTNKPKRVVINDAEMRTSIEQGELYTNHESVVIGILTNQVHVPGFNIADYLIREKFALREMENIEVIHSRIDPYQLICLMEFIRYRYPPELRHKIQNAEHNKTHIPHQSVDPSEFRSSLNQRDIFASSQHIAKNSNAAFSPMPSRLDAGSLNYDKPRRASQSPSDNARSQMNINAPRSQPGHYIPAGPNYINSPNPISSMATNSRANPLFFTPLTREQKLALTSPQTLPPPKSSSQFLPPFSISQQSVSRPPRPHSTIDGLGMGVLDVPAAINNPAFIRQPPAAHQSSSRPNLPGAVDMSSGPPHSLNAPIAAHMSSKTPQTPKLQEKTNIKVSPYTNNPYINKTNSQLPTPNHLDQQGSPTKQHDMENPSGLPMAAIMRQNEFASRDQVLRRSITPHFIPGGSHSHPSIIGPRSAELPRLDIGPRSPSHPSNQDILRVTGSASSLSMPPPHTRPSDNNKLSNSPAHQSNGDAHLKQYSAMMFAYQQQQLNLLPNKSPEITNSGVSTSSQQHSPGQAFYSGIFAPNPPDYQHFDMQQQPISPKQTNQRSIITGSASTNVKKGKKSKLSPPISAESTIENKARNFTEVVQRDSNEKKLLPSNAHLDDLQDSQILTQSNFIDTSNQLIKLAAVAAVAAPAINQHVGDSVARAVFSAQLSECPSATRTCVNADSERCNEVNVPEIPKLECNAAAIQLKGEADSGIKTSEIKNKGENVPVECTSAKADADCTTDNQNSVSTSDTSKYQKLFTKKAWLKTYDQEDQAKASDTVLEKVASATIITMEKDTDEVGKSVEVKDPKSNQPCAKTNGNSKTSKSKIDSKKRGKVNRDKSSSLSSLKTGRTTNNKNVENDSEETTASTSDLDDTTDEADSLKSTGDKKLRRMPRRKVKINSDREHNQTNSSAKSRTLKDSARKRAKKGKAPANSSDIDSTPSSVIKRKCNSDDEGLKQKNKKIKDNNGKSWEQGEENSSKKCLGEKFLQTCPCYDIVPKNIRCLECRRVRQSTIKSDKVVPSKQTSRTNWDDFCRFYEFRKLRYNKSDHIVVAGFSEMSDAKESDKKLWLPNATDIPTNFKYNVAKFILSNVGTEFCRLVLQERAVQVEYISKSGDKKITWKRAVNGLRELCDVCSTTLFNCHFVCERCGFVVCIDCHHQRANQQSNADNEKDDPESKDSPVMTNENSEEQASNIQSKKNKKDPDGWIYCAKNEEHLADKMILARIVASDCLEEVWTQLHKTRIRLNLGPCPCGHEYTTDPDDIIEDVQIETDQVSHSALKGLLLASNSPSHTTSGGDLDDGKSNEPETQNNIVSDTKVFDFSNEDSQDDSRQVSAAIEECIASLAAKASGDRRDQEAEQHRSNLSAMQVDQTLWTSLCDGDLLVLNQPKHKDNLTIFREHWRLGKPVLVRGVHKLMNIELWLPQFFAVQFGDYRSDLVDCRNGDIHRQSMKKYWDGFEPNINAKKKNKDDTLPSHIPLASNEEPSAITTTYYCGSALWRLKDWPPGQDFNEILPEHYNDFMNNLPLKSYTTRTGKLNLACRLPKEMLKPDLGPKMYSAYGTTKFPERGTTNLHLDICDAINVMVYVGGASSSNNGSPETREIFDKTIDETHVDSEMKSQIRNNRLVPGALWHIFKPSDAPKMRGFLNKVADERKISPEKRTDPIHDQIWYLDQNLLDRLHKECGVKSYPILQCMGDAILIPAGAPHQVKNLQNCIKVANDFVSPENVHWCLKLTNEFRKLPETHINQEDKLQIKNILYHSVKESLQFIKMSEMGMVKRGGSGADSDSFNESDADKTESDSDGQR